MSIKLHITSPFLNISTAINSNGITGITGPSGAGKTSLLRTIAGLDKHTGTTLSIGNKTLQKGRTFLPAHKRNIGYVFQEARLFPHLHVLGNIQYAAKRHFTTSTELDTLIELLNIQHLLQRSIHKLSGGEQQRVAIARTLASQPSLLLMDEPLSALDGAHKQALLPYIAKINRQLNIPVVYVSHSITELAQLCDDLYILENGHITAQGNTNQILTDLNLPFAHQSNAEAVLTATVKSYDADYHLLELNSDVGVIHAVSQQIDSGSLVKIQIAAKDVSLSNSKPAKSSILNVLPVTILALENLSNGYTLAKLQAGNTHLLSKITQKSAQNLLLKPGNKVYAQVKTAAILCE